MESTWPAVVYSVFVSSVQMEPHSGRLFAGSVTLRLLFSFEPPQNLNIEAGKCLSFRDIKRKEEIFR